MFVNVWGTRRIRGIVLFDELGDSQGILPNPTYSTTKNPTNGHATDDQPVRSATSAGNGGQINLSCPPLTGIGNPRIQPSRE